VLRTEPTGPSYDTARYGPVPALDTVAVHDEETGALAVFAVNRGPDDLTIDLDLRALPDLTGVAHVTVEAGDHTNTLQEPDRVLPRDRDRPDVDGARSRVALPAASWNLLRYARPPMKTPEEIPS
jgi:alpha-N-arabinofuranosidase